MTKREFKIVNKLYRKQLNKQNARFYTESNGLMYFITYLNYLRDIAILDTNLDQLNVDVSVSTLCYALKEYYASIDCINNYYNINNGVVTAKNSTADLNLVAESYNNEKLGHLNNFLILVRDNLSLWVSMYGGKI